MAQPIYSTTNWHLTVPAFNATAIRSTNAQESGSIDARGYHSKCVFIDNELNQPVSIQLQVSNSETGPWVNVSTAVSVAAASQATIDSSTSNQLTELAQPYPYYQLVATCTTAPTSGALTVDFFQSVL